MPAKVKIDHPVTPARKAHKSGSSIPARIVRMPKPSEDWSVLNPKLKGFKNAKVHDPSDDLPLKEQRMVTRGPVGGENTKGYSQR